MQIAILTFDGFNELDSFIAAGILNRMAAKGWKAHITAPTPRVTSMNGVTVEAERGLEFAAEADAVLFGSGIRTRDIAKDRGLLGRLRLDPARQLIGAQCSGTLLLAKLGLLGGRPACTDLTTKPWVLEAGVKVLDQPFYAEGNIATAGGLPGRAISGDMDTAARGHARGCRGGHALCGAGRAEGRVCRAGAWQRGAVSARDARPHCACA